MPERTEAQEAGELVPILAPPSMTRWNSCSKHQSYLWMKGKTLGWSTGEPSRVPEDDPLTVNSSAPLEEHYVFATFFPWNPIVHLETVPWPVEVGKSYEVWETLLVLP